LVFERLPHVCVKRTFRDVAVDLNLFIRVALAQYPPFPLLNVPRAPGRIEVMECHKTSLNVGAGAHLFGRTE